MKADKMADQRQTEFQIISSGGANVNNVEEITHRLDQMNMDQACRLNIVNFHEQAAGRVPLVSSQDSQDRMSVDDENVQPAGENRNEPTRGASRTESNILIVTNVDPAVFGDSLIKSKFESLFTAHDPQVLFRYLKSFRRVRLDFTSSRLAESARLNLNNYKLGATAFKCYLAQMIRPNNRGPYGNGEFDVRNQLGAQYDAHIEGGDRGNAPMFTSDDDQQQNNFYLSIPKPSKQFLISPPVSPPAGWKPHDESSPCIDVQLISAIANLVPGQVHEIHPGNESQPGIYVEVCEESQYDSSSANKRIPKTANPIAAARKAIGQAMKLS